MKKIIALIIAFTLSFSVLSGCSKKNSNKISATRIMMDTAVTITLYDSDETTLTECFEICQAYDNLFSRTNPESDVSHINDSNGKRTEVSTETSFLIGLSQQYCAKTDGKFDITIYPVSTLWNFENAVVPSSESIAEALPLINYNNVIVEDGFVTVANGSKIDLGAVAKGYISNALKEYLTQVGVKNAIINLGGNVVLIGDNTNGKGYSVGLKNPKKTDSNIATLVMSDKAIVTSGTYERHFELDGINYHHILDPKTGYPVNNGISSMTIISDDATYADILSTACFLLGSEDGMKLAVSEGCEAICILDDGKMLLTDGLKKIGKKITLK